VHETNNPVRIHRLELIPDSAGAGRFRGGCGIRKDVEILGDGATVVLLGDRHKKAPYGLFGGEPGSLARTVLVRGGVESDLGSKEVRQLERGDILSFRLAGAGGYGNPGERNAGAVRSDLADGLISKANAAAAYGAEFA
jgi:N-methylhydantoinase B